MPVHRERQSVPPSRSCHGVRRFRDRRAPVRAGARIRLRTTLLSMEDLGPGQYLMKAENTVEIEGEQTELAQARADPGISHRRA